MASSPITSWQIEEKQWKQWQTIFLGSKITADSDCIHEIKTLAPWKDSYDKAMINLDSMLKSRGITTLTKVCIVKTMVFPVVMMDVSCAVLSRSVVFDCL